MPLRNVIINGTFDNELTDWLEHDGEINTEGRYLDSDSENVVAEMDGEDNDITVLEQSFEVDSPTTTELTLDVALRDDAATSEGDGFTVEIIDSEGEVIASRTILPTEREMTAYSMPVEFESAGTYTIRFTEVGNDNSLGAIVDNISLMVCFAAGTQINQPEGAVLVEDLKAGDRVSTMDGPKTLRWIGRRTVSKSEMQENPKFQPVRITAGALGLGLPTTDLRVSRQHRMLANSPVATRMFGSETVLVSAIRLTEFPGIFVEDDVDEIVYYHLLFDAHEIVFANDAPSESLLTGPEAMKSLSPEAREEIFAMFPMLIAANEVTPPVYQIPPRERQKSFVFRLLKNDKQPLHRD